MITTTAPPRDQADGLSPEIATRVMRVLERYLAELERGVPPHPERLLAEHPDLAEPLRAYLASLDFLHRAALSLHSSPEAPGSHRCPEGGTGDVLGELGDFRLLREVGRGGMGIVYEAEQISLKRKVALKVLPFASTLDSRQLQRFKMEAQAAACLHHTNIVPVYATGVERGVHYYAMQFIEGHTLAEVIEGLRAEETKRRLRGLSPREEERAESSSATIGEICGSTSASTALAALSTLRSTKPTEFYRQVAELGIQGAEALEHAHQLGIVHRDVKPANLILDVRGNLWMTDFGLAQVQNDSTRLTLTGDLLGTLRYMSPEQALAKRVIVDHRTDIYSLGVTLYELLTLEPAFDGKDRQEVLRQIAFEEPKPPRRINRAIPPELETIVLKAMEKEPEGRYATAGELALDLRRWLVHEPIRARRPSVMQRVRKWGRRHRSVVRTTVAFLLLFAFMLMGTGVWVYKERERADVEATARLKTEALAQAREVWRRRYEYVTDLRDLQTQSRLTPERVRQVLDHHIPQEGQEDMRGFEWYHLKWLWREAPPPLLTLRGHVGDVYHVEFSPDGKLLASSGKDKTTRVWDAITGEKLGDLLGHSGEVNWVDFSPDGKLLVTASDDRTVRVWDVATLHEVQCYRGHTDHVVAAVFTKDSQSVISGGADRTLHHWEVNSGSLRRKLEGHQARIGSMSRSPNGTLLVTSSGADIRVWEIDTGKEIFKSSLPGFAKFSADGNSLLIALNGTTIRKVSLQGVVEAELQKMSGAIHTAAVTATSPFLVATGDGDELGHVQFWDIRGHFVQNVGIHPSRVWSVRFAPDGQRLASASRDGTICVWDARPQPALRRLTLPNPQAIYCATLSRDGKHLYLGNRDNRLRCWDVLSARQIGEWELPVESPPALALMPDQQTIVFTGGRRPHVITGLLDLQDSTVQKLTSLSGGMTRRAGDWLAVSHDGSVLAFHQCTMRVADHGDDFVASSAELFSISEMRLLGTLATNKGPPAVPPTVAFHPFRPILAVGGVDCPTFLYDYQRAEVTTRSPQFHVTALAFSTDGSLLAIGTHDGCIRLLDGVSLKEIAALDISSHVIVKPLVFSPDGRTLAGAAGDGVVRLWNIATGKVILSHRVVDKAITALCFTPDGKTLIVGATNGTSEEGELVFLYGTGAAAE